MALLFFRDGTGDGNHAVMCVMPQRELLHAEHEECRGRDAHCKLVQGALSMNERIWMFSTKKVIDEVCITSLMEGAMNGRAHWVAELGYDNGQGIQMQAAEVFKVVPHGRMSILQRRHGWVARKAERGLTQRAGFVCRLVEFVVTSLCSVANECGDFTSRHVCVCL